MDFVTLVLELENSVKIIHSLVEGITIDEARHKPTPEFWSVLEVMCHLYDLEREDFRQHLDSILHRPDEPWTLLDPESWITERNYNQRNLAETLEAFLAERDQSLAWLKSLPAPSWDSVHTDEYGSISAGEMFAAWVAHDNLHIRQLVELRQWRIKRLAEPVDISYAGEW